MLHGQRLPFINGCKNVYKTHESNITLPAYTVIMNYLRVFPGEASGHEAVLVLPVFVLT